VYLAGYESLGYVSGNFEQRACLWKNGVLQELQESENSNGFLNSVFVSNGDVYVIGQWMRLRKNGEVQKLANGEDHPGGYSVFVSGSDVYVAGGSGLYNVTSRDDVAKLWKNGVLQELENSENAKGGARSVFVSGSDVYVAGGIWNNKFWKNGKLYSFAGYEANLYTVFVVE